MSYPEAQSVEESVRSLKSKSVEAQSLVKIVNLSRDNISKITTQNYQ